MKPFKELLQAVVAQKSVYQHRHTDRQSLRNRATSRLDWQTAGLGNSTAPEVRLYGVEEIFHR